MNKELIIRTSTSIILLIILYLSYLNKYILAATLISIIFLSFIEFTNLINKMCNHFSVRILLLKILVFLIITIYLIFFSGIIWLFITDDAFKLLTLYIILVCVMTDVGGLITGKTFKGKKLTSLSPKKTYSGLFGAYFFSFLLAFIFYKKIGFNLYDISLITFLTCSFSQLGDLFFSYLKRKANLKDTGALLPGHGGILDRIDGILIGVPVGIFSSIFISFY